MSDLMASLQGLGWFGLYFCGALIILLAFKYLYALFTPHDEWALVLEKNNSAVAVGFIGAVIGFSLALASAITHSISIADFLVWALVALIAQIIAFTVIRLLFIPGLVERIKEGEMAAGIVLAGFSIAIGILNAACMTY